MYTRGFQQTLASTKSSLSLNLTTFNESINQFKEIYIFNNDFKNFNLTNIFNQKQIKKSIKTFHSKQFIKYYVSANIITLNKLYHSDCLQTIDFMKRRIHFNLFLHQQIDHFFLTCLKLEF